MPFAKSKGHAAFVLQLMLLVGLPDRERIDIASRCRCAFERLRCPHESAGLGWPIHSVRHRSFDHYRNRSAIAVGEACLLRPSRSITRVPSFAAPFGPLAFPVARVHRFPGCRAVMVGLSWQPISAAWVAKGEGRRRLWYSYD